MTIKYNNDAGDAGASENARPRSINRSGSACDHAHSLRIIDAAERLHGATSHEGDINLGLLAGALAQTGRTNPAMPESFAFFDLETTGLDSRFDQILQVAAVRCDAELRVVETFNLRCDVLPWQAPSPEALLTTRTEPDQLSGTGRSLYAIMDEFAETIERWRTESLPVAHDTDGDRPVDDLGMSARCRVLWAGYNNLRFDDELLRHSLFAALHPPYMMQAPFSRRADVLSLVHLAHLLKPGSIVVPIAREDGNGLARPSFRLGDIARANGIGLAEDEAHDALADVIATVAVAKLVRDRAPQAFELWLDGTDKNGVLQALLSQWSGVPGAYHGAPGLRAGPCHDGAAPQGGVARPERLAPIAAPDADEMLELARQRLTPFLHLWIQDGEGRAIAVLPLGLLPGAGSSTLVALDLTVDPASYLDMPRDRMRQLVRAKRSPLVTLRLNRQPALVPFEPRQPWLPDAAQRLVAELAPEGADDVNSAAAAVLANRLRDILRHHLSDPGWIGRMIAITAEAQPLYPEPVHVEQQLYSGGFIGRQDDALRARMLRMTPSDFVRHIPALFDERLREHAWRRAFVEAPGELPPDEHQRLQDWRISRRHCADDVPWRTLSAARHEVARIRQQALVDLAASSTSDPAAAERLARLADIDSWIGAQISADAETVRRAGQAISQECAQHPRSIVVTSGPAA